MSSSARDAVVNQAVDTEPHLSAEVKLTLRIETRAFFTPRARAYSSSERRGASRKSRGVAIAYSTASAAHVN